MIPDIRKKQVGLFATTSKKEVVANRNTLHGENTTDGLL
jgi:hypothetical protein